MNDELQKADEKGLIEYIPYGAQDKIKLSVSIVKNLICVKTKSGKTCSDQDAIRFLALCQARRLSPFEGDCFLIGYDTKEGPTFSLITAHQAFLKRAELNPEYDGMKSGIIVEDDDKLIDLEGDFYTAGQKVVGGWATVFFKNRKQPMHKRIRLERFQKAWGIWQDDAAGMICKCAEADALRSSFPTLLGGLYIKEESPTAPKLEVSAPIFSTTSAEPETETRRESGVDFVPPHPLAIERKPRKKKEPEPETPVSLIRKDIVAEGLTEGLTDIDVLAFLKEIGSIEPSVDTLETVALQSPEVLEMLTKNKHDIFNRIKMSKTNPEEQ
jgi:phage recombination protein Bet